MADDDARIIIFRNRVREGAEGAYGPRADGVYELARRMPGFVASKDFVADDGERLALIEFDSPAHLAAWRTHAGHRVAQQEGRSRWYDEYVLQVCAVLRESRYRAGSDPEPLPDPAAGPFERVEGEGGCACRAVRYRVRGRPRVAALCHCRDCRLSCGATPVAWAVFRRGDVEWLTAPPKERASSERAFRSFCAECGAQIAFRYTAYPDHIDLTIASLDEPERIAPRDHIWVRSKVAWVHLRDELARHERDIELDSPPGP